MSEEQSGKSCPRKGPATGWWPGGGRGCVSVCSEMEGAKMSESLDWHLQKQALDPMGVLRHQCFVSRV